MWQSFLNALQTQLSKQVVAGAIALGLVGVVAALLRHLPAALWVQVQRLVVVQAAPLVAEDEAATPDVPRLQYSPAPGFHLFWFQGRPMWMRREIAMKLQVVETIHLGALFASRRHMERLLNALDGVGAAMRPAA